jgi:preprotein translocase subunit SecD
MSQVIKKFIETSFFGWILFAAAIVGYLYMSGKNNIKYGIDLVGGTYITLEVQEDDVTKNHLNDKIKGLQSALDQKGIELTKRAVLSKDSIVFSFQSKTDARDAEALLQKEAPRLTYALVDLDLTATIGSSLKSQLISEAVRANVDILRSRFSHLSETPISAQGEKQIVVELPNVSDPYQAKEMIGKSAVLEFKLVEDSAASREALLDKYDHELPEGTMILPGKSRGSKDKYYYLLPEYTPVSGSYFKSSSVETGGGKFGNELAVAFEFDSEGGDRFYELTSENIGQLLAIVLDDEVIQVATIQSGIRNRGSISGGFQYEEAKNLSTMLKSGSFKAKVNFIEERQIGPTLGQESIRKGLLSCLIGLGLLFLFGIFYYSLSGFFAFLALVYNLLLVLLCMSLFKATLTLPGIAGMVLTIGMAIDASILIYEQIKEALARGETISAAVQEGFSDAMYVILDANITTFIVAAVLFYFGTGPIQGFAVTMMIGIVSTLITGLFFLRSLFQAYLRFFNVKKLRI